MTREVVEALQRLRPHLGSKADTLWALYLSLDRVGRQEIEQTVRLLDLKRNRTTPGAGPPPLPPPEAGVLAGWLRLGDAVYPGRPPASFGLEPGELIQHVGIFGRSGAGKTNTVLCLLRGLLDKGVPFLIFDWKRNYRDLLAVPWVPEGRVVVLTAGRDLAPLRLNPLRPPPGTDPRTWLKKLIEIIAHAYFLGEGVMYLLQEAIDAAYREAGVYTGSGRYPTFHDVHARLRARKVTGREANWMASTLRTLGALTFGPMAETACAAEPADVTELLGRNVILELDALTDSDKVLVVESLLLYIHHLRLAQPERERLKHVILVEEAHHVFLRSKQELAGGEPVTDIILREIRELGEAVVLVDQHPSQIAITALGNTYCTIAMNLKHRSDVNTVADSCLLEPDQKEHLGRLAVGQAVVKLQDRWPAPFQVRFPLVEIRKGSVTDAVIARQVALPSPSEAGNHTIPPREGAGAVIPEVPDAPEAGPDERRLLADVADHAGSSVTDRYNRLGLSRRKGTVVKERLVKAGLAIQLPVALPGGRVTLLEPTARGWDQLARPRPGPQQGGAVHRFWVERVAEAFRRRGYSVEAEVPCGSGAIDLVATSEHERVPVEVEVSGRRLASSIEKLSTETGARRILACASRRMLERAQTRVREAGRSEEIDVVHVWSLLRAAASKNKTQGTRRRGCGA